MSKKKAAQAVHGADDWEEHCKMEFLRWQDLEVLATCEASVLQPGAKIGGRTKVYRIALVKHIEKKEISVLVMRTKGQNINKHVLSLNACVSVVVDAQPDDDEQIFSLTLDNQPWYFRVTNFKKKIGFVSATIKAAEKDLPQRIAFETVHVRSLASVSLDMMSGEVGDVYEEVSVREARALNQIIGQNKQWFQNGLAYAAGLSKELDIAERAQIVTILQSEKVTIDIQARIDEMLQQVDKMAKKIREYNTELALMRPDVSRLLKRDILYTIQSTNYEKLRSDLNNLLELLDAGEIERKYNVLKEGESDLNSDEGRRVCLHAARSLTNAKDLSLQSGMSGLSAVATTVRIIEEKERHFVNRLKQKLGSIIQQQSNRQPDIQKTSCLPSHKTDFNELLPFAHLVMWLRTSQFSTFEWLISTYSANLGTRYSREMESVHKSMLMPFSMRSSIARGNGGGDVGVYNPTTVSEEDIELSGQLYQLFRKLMIEVAVYFKAERDFFKMMFYVEKEPIAGEAVVHTKFGDLEAQNSLNSMFSGLPILVDKFLILAYKMDRMNSIPMFLVLFDSVSVNKEGPKSILTSTLATRQVDVKRKFTALMNEEADKYNEAIHSRRKGNKDKDKNFSNILDFCKAFPIFAGAVEAKLFGNRCHEVDKALQTLARKLLVGIESSAAGSSLIMFENFHFISHELKLLKLDHLKNVQNEAQDKYKMYINAYVKENLGHPMEKLSKFMKGIQSLVDSGVKESEISFQLQYSRQNLKKLIDAYPDKEVKKGLVSTYRRVERDMGLGSSQLQVVWRYMQDDFITQYQEYDMVIKKCYPNTGLHLDFTVNDLLSYFSSIAASH
eukprot:CFRG5760T1